MRVRLIVWQQKILAVTGLVPHAAFAAALVMCGAAAAYADSPSPPARAPAPAPAVAPASAPAAGSLEDAEFKVNSGDYRAAIPLLSAIVQRDPRNADALNLMGFSLRKTGQYDLSLQYYNAALAIDPQNLGANEYLGELYVQMGQPAKAKHQLEILTAACGADCRQTQDLAAAIAQGGPR
jgi:tetratricopeptide (TPR) repeat protein